jgi:hypothetical protein
MASSGPELDLEFLTSRKEEIAVSKGIHTLMCFYGDNCNLVKCMIVRYAYDTRFFMCVNYEHDPIKPFINVRPKIRTTYISELFISHCYFTM